MDDWRRTDDRTAALLFANALPRSRRRIRRKSDQSPGLEEDRRVAGENRARKKIDAAAVEAAVLSRGYLLAAENGGLYSSGPPTDLFSSLQDRHTLARLF